MAAIHTICSYDQRFERTPASVPEMLVRLICFWRWINAGFGFIRDDREQVRPIRLNRSQERILAAMMDQAADEQPIRVVCGKARKHGASTLIQLLFVFLCAHYPNQRAITIAHEADATNEIFDIAQRAAERYAPIVPVDPKDRVIRYYGQGSRYTCHTAGGVAVGAGGTPNLLHQSELSKWEKNKAKTEYNSKISVPRRLTTIVFVESTFCGRELFHNNFTKAAEPDNPYAQLFNAWYLDERCVIDGFAGFALNDEERRLVRMAHDQGIELSKGQLAWRRSMVAELGEDVFRQEFPSTPEEAVQGTAGLLFPHMWDCLVDDLPFDMSNVPAEDLVGGIDFGYHDPTVIWTAVYNSGVLWLAQYYRRAEGLAKDHVAGLVHGCLYYCDPSGLTDRRGLQVAAAEAGVGARLTAAPRKKHTGEDCGATEMKALIRFAETGRLRIHRDVAEQLLLEADNLAWDERSGKIGDKRSAECGHFDSLYALKYLVMGVEGQVGERPPQAAQPATRRSQFARF